MIWAWANFELIEDALAGEDLGVVAAISAALVQIAANPIEPNVDYDVVSGHRRMERERYVVSLPGGWILTYTHFQHGWRDIEGPVIMIRQLYLDPTRD